MRLGLFTDAFADRPLGEALDWLAEAFPEIRDLEIGTGGYSPAPHSNDLAEALARGYRIAALNVSGNPLEVAEHDRALREAVRLAGEFGVERVVCMSGGDPKLSGGGWFPGVEDATEVYWQERVLPYWTELARLEGVRLCLELEPGSAVYNVSTFERLAVLGPSIAVNLDPSHFFWQGIDPLVAARRFGERIGWAHGKDTFLDAERLSLDGGLDRGSWRYTTVGHGHDLDWWARFLDALAEAGYDGVVSIEFEDELVAAEESVAESARLLEQALGRVTA
jgi:sugar phosphate isomerase/epimerase